MALTEDEPISLSFYRTIRKTEIYASRVFKIKLLFSATPIAPKTFDSSESSYIRNYEPPKAEYYQALRLFVKWKQI